MNCHVLWATLTITALVTAPAVAAPKIDVVLATDPDFNANNSRDWYQAVLDAGANNLQIRAATAGDCVQIETLPADAGYRVTGRLTADNQLLLPGAKFGLSNRNGIRAWLATLRDEGPARVQGEPKAAFGLSKEQLEDVTRDLSTKVADSTKGQPPRQTIRSLAEKLSHPIVAEPAVGEQLSRADPIRDELQGLSTGTAISAILRPEGLVLVPRLDAARNVQYVVTRGQAEKEVWPVGWESKKQPPDLLPALFEPRNVEVANIPIADVIKAIGDRLETPILYDHNALARHGTDLRKKVSMTRTKTPYAAALHKLLVQAELKYELREDEAGKPLLWITSTLPD